MEFKSSLLTVAGCDLVLAAEVLGRHLLGCLSWCGHVRTMKPEFKSYCISILLHDIGQLTRSLSLSFLLWKIS